MPRRLCAALILMAAVDASAQVYVRRNASGVLEATNIPAAPDFRLIYPGKGTLIHSRTFRASSYRGAYDGLIIDAARTYGVSPDVVKAVIQVESEFDANAVSSKGAQGLMQLMPATAQRFAVADVFDPRQNIFGGTQYLRLLLDLFSGDLSLALAAYNAGEGAVLRFRGIPPFKETQDYVGRIQAILGSRLPEPSPPPAMAAAPTPASFKPRPVRTPKPKPRLYYRWRDEQGVLHVATSPPDASGTPFTVIRVVD